MYILFDIGGTKTRIAGSDDLASFGAPHKYDTKLSYREGIEDMIAHMRELAGTSQVTAIAGGIRGPLNHEKTGIIKESVLTDWVGRSIVGDLSKAMGCPVYLENDTAIVGLGEAVFGAGRGHRIVAYHTVSTGVGGARFVEGKIDVASIGFEPGHQELDIDRNILGPSVPPTLENLVSGTALERARGVKPYEIPQSDPVWNQLAEYLAHGLRNTILYWSPDVIVLGGSMIVGNPRILLQDVQQHLTTILNKFVPCPLIVDAELKDEGGLYGAMALLRQKVDSKGKSSTR